MMLMIFLLRHCVVGTSSRAHEFSNLSVRLLRGVRLRGALVGRGHRRCEGGGRVQFIRHGGRVQGDLLDLGGRRQRQRALCTLLLRRPGHTHTHTSVSAQGPASPAGIKVCDSLVTMTSVHNLYHSESGQDHFFLSSIFKIQQGRQG